IKQKSGYDYVYNANLVDDQIRLDYYADDEPLETVLERSLSQVGLDFNINNAIISISKVSVTNRSSNNQQEYKYSGVVKDDTGLGLPGVTIKIDGISPVAATDESGRFAFSQRLDKVTVEFSMMGFKTIQSALIPNKNAEILMEKDVSA